MVIHQFNKLIRNKWVWGAFAIAISAFFAFDFLLADLDRPTESRNDGSAGKLAGEAIDGRVFTAIADEIRGYGRQRDYNRDQGEVNRMAWENYAALKVAQADGVEATDAEVKAMIRNDRTFQANGGFSFALYQRLLMENKISIDEFEASLKRRITLMRLGQAVLGSATWTSPTELDQAVADMTDTFTVKVATFTQDKKDADKVKLDDKGLKAWYDKNIKSLALPNRIKIRYVKFDARNPMTLAKMKVTEDEMRDCYDVNIDKYTTTDTNGVEKVKKFEEVKADLEKELRQIAALQFYETNINYRTYAVKSALGKSRLDEIAKEEGLKVETSDWFSIEGGYHEGFMRSASSICPGVDNFNEAVAELDTMSDDLRYGIVASDTYVWLIEIAETSPKHTPTFEEAKSAISARALRDAKADAFKAQVEAVAKQGAKAVVAVKGVSTNITFTVSDLRQGAGGLFENEMAVARASMKLFEGEVSEFTSIGYGKAILVVCEKRVAGDAAKAAVLRTQIRDDLAMLQLRQIPDSWKKWNLERLGFEAGDVSSVETAEEE